MIRLVSLKDHSEGMMKKGFEEISTGGSGPRQRLHAATQVGSNESMS